jgi:hypothetical protein
VLFVVASAAAIIGGTLMVLPVEEAGTFADIAATEPVPPIADFPRVDHRISPGGTRGGVLRGAA